MLFKSSAYNRHSIEFNLTEFNSVNQIQLNQIKFVFNDKRLKQPVQTGNELRDCTVAQDNRKKDAFELLLMQSLTVLRLIIYPKRKERLQKRRLKLPARSTKAQLIQFCVIVSTFHVLSHFFLLLVEHWWLRVDQTTAGGSHCTGCSLNVFVLSVTRNHVPLWPTTNLMSWWFIIIKTLSS